MTYRERRLARAARLEEWAEKRAAKAGDNFTTVRSLVKDVPFGQPILVGHHSERASLRHRDRVIGAMDRGVENSQKSEEMKSKARNIRSAVDRAIYDDDADAIDRLRKQIAKAESLRYEIKAYNLSVKAGHADESLLGEDMRRNLHKLLGMPGMMGKGGQLPSSLCSGLSSGISKNRKRLARLERDSSASR
ncbi:DUF3560 domain-containing protein [Rhodococcus qingshengii]|uniref:DUF3560 domain-containing protein n=1 Tax=Rhodococcus qingshengii TaxID=334542 RepID=UPI001C5F588E|nr:DUF3560 domain-containing protein [Rhodococcus qingshengii]MBW4818720.1 DUF3560 domain-containing protein [Rhodococcus qingshengii]